MTHIISAFPCLGKTTIYQLNKNRVFDREFNESHSVLGMNAAQRDEFSQLCADIINLQALTGHYDYIFVTDDHNIISRLKAYRSFSEDHQDTEITFIFPNIFDDKVMRDYKHRVVIRSGEDWYGRVIIPRLDMTSYWIEEYQKSGYDVRLTDLKTPYIEDIFQFNHRIILPNGKNN